MNSDKLTVAALPVDIAFGQVETNLAAARKAAAQASADILVLPELFSTGYTTAPAAMHALAAEAAAPSLETVRGIAADTGSAVAGSFASADHTNRAFLVQPDGSTTFYDKHHLFTLGREQRVFRAGIGEVPVTEFRGWRVALSVCYDLRFPAWLHNRGYAYDIMLLPANWPQARAYALEHLLIARAIENQAPIVCANRSGTDPYGTYDGCSYAFDHLGRPAFADDTLTATFSLDSLRRARTSHPFAFDADSWTWT